MKRSFVAADWNADGIVDRCCRPFAPFRTSSFSLTPLTYTHSTTSLTIVCCAVSGAAVESRQEGIQEAGSRYWRLCDVRRLRHPLQQHKPRSSRAGWLRVCAHVDEVISPTSALACMRKLECACALAITLVKMRVFNVCLRTCVHTGTMKSSSTNFTARAAPTSSGAVPWLLVQVRDAGHGGRCSECKLTCIASTSL